MRPTEQTNHIPGTIHDEGKEVRDIAPKEAHVQGF